MNHNDNSPLFVLFIIINILITVSCKDCWIISSGIVGVVIIVKCFAVVFCYKSRQSIYPSQELTNIYHNSNHNLSITIDNSPDFSRLYIRETLSPLHQPLFTCSICLDDSTENVKTLLCGHKFHKDCIEEWFDREETCPMCRIEFNA